MTRCNEFDRAFEAARSSVGKGPFDLTSKLNAKDGFTVVMSGDESARVSAMFDPSNVTARRLPPGRARSLVAADRLEAAARRSAVAFEPEGYSIKVETAFGDYVDFIHILLDDNPGFSVCFRSTKMARGDRPLFALSEDPGGRTPLLTAKASNFVQEIVVFLALAAGYRDDEGLVRVLAREAVRNLLQWRRYDAALFAAALEADRVTTSSKEKPRDSSAALSGKGVFAEVLEAVGRFREASKIYFEIVDEKQALGGEVSQTACSDCCNAGLALKRIGAWDEAERAYSRAVALGAEYRTRTGRDPTDGFPAGILDNLEKLLWARGEECLSALLRGVGMAAGLSYDEPHPLGDETCSLFAKLPRGAKTARDAIRDFGERQMPLREILLKLASRAFHSFHSTLNNSREVIEQQPHDDNNNNQKKKTTTNRQQGAKAARDSVRASSKTTVACSNCCNPPDLKKPLSACRRCKAVSYCSKACQTEHWKKIHRSQCCPTAEYR